MTKEFFNENAGNSSNLDSKKYARIKHSLLFLQLQNPARSNSRAADHRQSFWLCYSLFQLFALHLRPTIWWWPKNLENFQQAVRWIFRRQEYRYLLSYVVEPI